MPHDRSGNGQNNFPHIRKQWRLGMLNDRIAFIGAGKMAGAIALGLVNKGIPPAQLCAYDPSPEAAKKFAELTGAVCTATMKDALKDAGIVLFAVKPQYAKAAFDEAREHLGGKLLISIAAGLSISKLTQLSGGIGRIIRVMPNTPALVGEGMSCFCGAAGATEDDMKKAGEILSSFGLCRKVPESMLDAVTGLSGSGPAYVLEFIMALADGGVYAGLPRDAAIELAAQTVFGSALMVLKRGKEHPAVLRDAVISPGGTTARGVAALDEGAFRSTVMKAVVAAAERSAELDKQ